MKKEFGDILTESWKEYRSNFKVFLKIFLIFSAIPALLLLILGMSFVYNFNSSLTDLVSPQQNIDFFLSSGVMPYWIIGAILLISVVVLGTFMRTSFLYNALYRKKEMSFKETLNGGKKYFWKFFWFSIVELIFLAGLFILFVVPGIIFAVFWVFAPYVLIGNNKGILKSLKESHKIIKGNWWKVLGYAILFTLVLFLISIVFSVANGIISFAIQLPFGFGVTGILPFYITAIISLVDQLMNLGMNLIVIPFGILFYKNFYLDMKGEKTEMKSEKK